MYYIHNFVTMVEVDSVGWTPERNSVGWTSVVRAKNLAMFLLPLQKEELLSIIAGITWPVADSVRRILTTQDWKVAIDPESAIIPETIMSESNWSLEVLVKARLENIFNAIYVAKEMRFMSGEDALQFAKNHWGSLTPISCSTLMRQVKESDNVELLKDVIEFVERFYAVTKCRKVTIGSKIQLRNLQRRVRDLENQSSIQDETSTAGI